MVITDDDFFETEVAASYQRGLDAVPAADVFYPVAGAHFRPGSIFVPK